MVRRCSTTSVAAPRTALVAVLLALAAVLQGCTEDVKMQIVEVENQTDHTDKTLAIAQTEEEQATQPVNDADLGEESALAEVAAGNALPNRFWTNFVHGRAKVPKETNQTDEGHPTGQTEEKQALRPIDDEDGEEASALVDVADANAPYPTNHIPFRSRGLSYYENSRLHAVKTHKYPPMKEPLPQMRIEKAEAGPNPAEDETKSVVADKAEEAREDSEFESLPMPSREKPEEGKAVLRQRVQKASEGDDLDELIDAMALAGELHLHPEEALTFDKAEERLLQMVLRHVEAAKEKGHLARIPAAIELLYDMARSKRLEGAYLRKLAEVEGAASAKEEQERLGKAKVSKEAYKEAVIYGLGKAPWEMEHEEERSEQESARAGGEAASREPAAQADEEAKVDAEVAEARSELREIETQRESAAAAEATAALLRRVHSATEGSDLDALVDAIDAAGELHLRPEHAATFDAAEHRVLHLGLQRVESAKVKDHLHRVSAAIKVLFDEARSQELESAYVRKLSEVEGLAKAREEEQKLGELKEQRNMYKETVVSELGEAMEKFVGRGSRTPKHEKGVASRRPETKQKREATAKLRRRIQRATAGDDMDELIDAMAPAGELHLRPDEALTFDKAEQRLLHLGLQRVESAKERGHLHRIPAAIDLLFDMARSKELEDSYVGKLAEVDGASSAKEAERKLSKTKERKTTYMEAMMYGLFDEAPQQAKQGIDAMGADAGAEAVSVAREADIKPNEEDAASREARAVLTQRVQKATEGSDLDELMEAMSAAGELHLRPEEAETFDPAEERVLHLGLQRVESAKEKDHLQGIPAAINLLVDEARSQQLEDKYVSKLNEVEGLSAAREAEEMLRPLKVRRRTYAEMVLYGLGKAPWELELEALEARERGEASPLDAEAFSREVASVAHPEGTEAQPSAAARAAEENGFGDEDLAPGTPGAAKRSRRAPQATRTAKHNKGHRSRSPEQKSNRKALAWLRRRVQLATAGSDMDALLDALRAAGELARDPSESLTIKHAEERLHTLASQRLRAAKVSGDLAHIPAVIDVITDSSLRRDLEVEYRERRAELGSSLIQVAAKPHGTVSAHYALSRDIGALTAKRAQR